jgi:hypothetical protein
MTQVMHEGGIIEKIEHERVDAAQIGGFGAGAFDPAFDEQLAADALAEKLDGLDAIVHSAAAEGIGDFQRREGNGIGKASVGFIDGGWLIVEVPHVRAAVGGFAAGVGNA